MVDYIEHVDHSIGVIKNSQSRMLIHDWLLFEIEFNKLIDN